MIPILSEDAELILAFIKKHPGIGQKQIALELDIDYERIYEAIEMLERKGFIEARYLKDFEVFTEGENPYRRAKFFAKE